MKAFIRKSVLAAAAACVLASLCGCGEKSLAPADPKWDRTVCEHCKMAVSDPHFSAQVVTKDGEHLYFDDLGCAVVWISRHAAAAQGSVLYANHAEKGGWIAEKDALFAVQYVTPMAYGIGTLKAGEAVPDGKSAITAEAMRQRIAQTFHQKQLRRAAQGHAHGQGAGQAK